MYFILAVFPVFLALLLMTRFRVQPGYAMPVSLVCTVCTAFFAWHMPASGIFASAVSGLLKSLDIILIVYCAVLLLNILKHNNALVLINNTFSRISPDRRIQVVIIAWLFSSFIEGAAGFGSAPALVAPLLAGMGFPVMTACVVALIGNTLPVPFGAVGTPVITLNSILSPDLASCGINQQAFEHAAMALFTDISMLAGIFLPFVMVVAMLLFSRRPGWWRSALEIFPFCIMSGTVYFVPWKLAAVFLGPELPSMIGTVIALPLMLLVLKLKVRFFVPENIWDFETSSGTADAEKADVRATVKAWIPYILIALLLVLTRLPMLPFRSWLQFFVISTPPVAGLSGTAFNWQFFYNSGVFPFFAVSIFTMFMYGIKNQQAGKVFCGTAKQISQSAVAIGASFAVVQIMVFSGIGGLPGMLNVIAGSVAAFFSKAYIAASPLIGVLGTFFAGSCTVSNILFGSIQFNTAHLAGLQEEMIIALQNFGGGLGSMIRISGVVATCATVNAKGLEGRIILFNCIPVAVMVILGLLAAFFLM